MSDQTLQAQPLTADSFAAFGEVIEMPGARQIAINRGKCIRHHALATAQVSGPDPSVVISIFSASAYPLPHVLDLVERHPLGSQAFYPLGSDPWLVTVCEDENGVPGPPRAFLASPDQGINVFPNTWHGVLTPLGSASDFLVVDRAGGGENLEEFAIDKPWTIEVAEDLYVRFK
ncbi:MAG: ureidoglycolate lyase [Pseudomonadota bacterium]